MFSIFIEKFYTENDIWFIKGRKMVFIWCLLSVRSFIVCLFNYIIVVFLIWDNSYFLFGR